MRRMRVMTIGGSNRRSELQTNDMIFVTLATLVFMTQPSSLCERCRVHSVAVCLLWIPAHVAF